MGYVAEPSTSDTTIFKWNTAENQFHSVAGAFALASVASWTGEVVKNGAGTQNDTIYLGDVYIPVTAPYTFYVVTEHNTANGIMTVQLNGTSKGTIDTYAGASTFNNQDTLAMGSIAKGQYALSIKMATKHASATAYVGVISEAGVYKT